MEEARVLTRPERGAARILSFSILLLTVSMGIVAVSNLARSANATPPSGTTFDHAVIIIMEDHGMQDICAGSPPPCSSTNGDPYIAGLANSYAIGSQYLGVSHYSQTDYLALLGGDTFGCSGTSCPWPFNAPNLVDRFEAAGLTWKGYMENQNSASGCDTTYHEPYTPEHNPFVGFTDIVDSPSRCANVVLANPSSCTVTDCVLVNDLNSASAPSFMWLTPNNCDNMHGFTGICSTSIPMGDNYLSGLVPNILKSYTFTNTRAALFVVFDEGTGYCPLNGSSEDCVYAAWAGPLAKTGFVTSNLYNHYSWTRTIETNWNLASLTSNDAKATPMTEFFKSAAPPVLTNTFAYSPSSPQVGQQITFTASASGGTTPYTFSWNFGDGTSGIGITTTHSYSTTGTFTVALTTKDSGTPQQTATSRQSVTVISAPPPPSSLTASFTYSPASPQVSQQVIFTGSASGGKAPYSFVWNFGDGSTGTGATPTHAYSSAGTFTVLLTVKDNGTPQQTATSQQSVTVNSTPSTLSAGFTYSPASPSVSQQVTFTATATGGTSPYSFSWNFGDGSTGTGFTASHTYSSAGTVTVILMVKDSGSPQQTATSQRSLTVASPPSQLTASFSYSPTNPETGQTISFTGSASGGTSPYIYSWNFGDGSTGTGSTATHGYSTAGTFTVVLTVKDSSSPQHTVSSQQTVTVTNAPSTLTVSFSYTPSSPSVGQSITFAASASGGTNPYTFTWNFGDGSTGTGSSVSHTYQSAGSFTVILTVSDHGSPQQTATSQQSITVASPPPSLTAGFSFSPSSPQTGQPVSFTGSASGGTAPYAYSWSFGDGSTGSGGSTAHTYSSAGSYSVVLTVTDSGSPQQTATSQHSITVTSPPPALTASFTNSPASPQTGQQVTFSASTSGGTTPYSFSWNFGDGSTGTGSSATHAYPSAGTFTAVLTVTDTGSPQQTTTAQKSIMVTSPSPPLATSFTYTPSSPQTGQQVSFAASASGGTSPYSFSWDFGDGSSGVGGSATHSYQTAGNYAVTVTASDAGGQKATSSRTITITSPPPPLSVSFSYTPNSPEAGRTVSFTSSVSGGTPSYSYSWSFGDSSTGSGSSPTHTYSSAGTVTVTLTVTDAAGIIAKSSQTITVSLALQASFAYSPSSPLPLQTVTFTASATGGIGPYTYSWDFGDGSTSSSSTTSHSFLLPGSYTVKLTVTDAKGYTVTISQTITVLTAL